MHVRIIRNNNNNRPMSHIIIVFSKINNVITQENASRAIPFNFLQFSYNNYISMKYN